MKLANDRVWNDGRMRIGDSKENFLLVRLYYSLGGYNLFTYKEEPRGYYLSVSPVRRIDRGGYFMIESCPMDGLKRFVGEPVKRRSAKGDAAAEVAAKAVLEELVSHVCLKNGIDRATVGELVFD